ncbi:DUF6009 family protein [Actinomadura keratinilytica]
MSSLLHESQLVHESTLVWLEDPDNFDYVRQALDKTGSAQASPATPATDAWSATPNSTAKPTQARTAASSSAAPSSSSHDRPDDPEGPYEVGAPGEAVDPRTLQPKRVGEKTPRSQGESKPTVR